MSLIDSIKSGDRVLLLNPPSCDTEDAYGKQMIGCEAPFGLLRLVTYFRNKDCKVDFIDCQKDPLLKGEVKRHVRKILPCGNREENISKAIYHFGLDRQQLEERLQTLEPPDYILISSIFFWHFEVIKESIAVCRKVFPQAKIIHGGNIATVLPEECRHLGADETYVGDLDAATFLKPAMDLDPLARDRGYVRMIKGCVYNCSYCICNILNSNRVFARNPEDVFREMLETHRDFGTRSFICYDDFVLYKRKEYFDVLLDLFIAEKPDFKLEFPNGFSAHLLTTDLIEKLFEARVERIRIALETINPVRNKSMNRPVSIEAFIGTLRNLQSCGYPPEKISTFFLVGLPGQTIDEILTGILFIYYLRLIPNLTCYTLTPGSLDAEKYGYKAGDSLEQFMPYLWKFASNEMKAGDLDTVNTYFHDRIYSLERILASETDDPIICKMQKIAMSREFAELKRYAASIAGRAG